jgi:anti-sigma factor RsiW
MPCYSEESMMQYLDGEMTEAQAAAFEEHLRACRHCEEAFDGYVRLYQELAGMGMPEPAAEFTAAVPY